jgi:hypothetical protein
MHVGLGDILSDLKARIIAQRAAIRAATSPSAKATALSGLLNAIGQLAAQYRLQGNEALAARWMVEYRALQDDSVQAHDLAREKGPSAAMQALDAVSDRAIHFADTIAKTVEKSVTAVGEAAGGAAATVKALPWLIPLALVAVAFVVGGGGLGGVLKARRSNPRRRR